MRQWRLRKECDAHGHTLLYDLSPGEAQCPYHYEYNEEWLLVVDGTTTRPNRVVDAARARLSANPWMSPRSRS
jgi:uncharacterized cupin superfamily protein